MNFKIVQHVRDANLLKSFEQIFGCGFFSISEKSGIGIFTVSNFSEIIDKIIPFFEEVRAFRPPNVGGQKLMIMRTLKNRQSLLNLKPI